MKIKSGKDKMLTLAGKGVSPGLAKGKAFVYIDALQRDSELYQIDPAQVGEEQARIERALDDVRQSLTIDAKHIEGKLARMFHKTANGARSCPASSDSRRDRDDRPVIRMRIGDGNRSYPG
jgi:hypothetical protein